MNKNIIATIGHSKELQYICDTANSKLTISSGSYYSDYTIFDGSKLIAIFDCKGKAKYINELYKIYGLDGEILKDVFFSKKETRRDVEKYLQYKKLIGVGGKFTFDREFMVIRVLKFGK